MSYSDDDYGSHITSEDGSSDGSGLKKYQSLNLEAIAAKAGVSRSTVSRVVNNHPNVSERTRSRVMRVIEREGYSPHPAARMLVTQRTEVIGVVLPHLGNAVLNDAYHFRLLQGIAKITSARNYAILLWMQEPNVAESSFYERIRRNRLMDGLLVTPVTQGSLIMERLAADNIPYVTVERAEAQGATAGYVTIDNVSAAEEVVRYFLSRGRQRIGFINGPLNNVDAVDRLIGYRQALTASGLPYDETCVSIGDFSRESGYRGARDLYPQGIDAIFAANDYVALGAMDYLQEVGAKVPQEIAIIGFDDHPFAAQHTPRLATVRQPVEKKGELAVELLIDTIEGRPREARTMILPTELIIRESAEV